MASALKYQRPRVFICTKEQRRCKMNASDFARLLEKEPEKLICLASEANKQQHLLFALTSCSKIYEWNATALMGRARIVR